MQRVETVPVPVRRKPLTFNFHARERTGKLRERRGNMQYLVQMKLASHSRPNSPQEEINFMQGYIFPSLEMLKKLQE